MPSASLKLEDFERIANVYCKGWAVTSINAVRAILVDGERVSIVAKQCGVKPQTIVTLRKRFLNIFYAKSPVKLEAEQFMRRVVPDGAGALKPFRTELKRLLASGYSPRQIAEYLRVNDVNVKATVLNEFLKGLE